MYRWTSPRMLVAALLLATLAAVGIASERSASNMATAANAFLASLTPAQRTAAALPFGDERLRWHFIPPDDFPRKGVTFKEMTPAQRKLAENLLRTGLSQRGYLTVTQIMELEAILRVLEQNATNRRARDPEQYYVTVFGTPSKQGAWGWKVEGHHLSLNFTIANGVAVASAPAFFGSNPAEVREGEKKGLRVLGAEEDAARALLGTLDAQQRTTAVIANVAPNEIVTGGNKPTTDPLTPGGIAASALRQDQRELLMRLVDVYVSKMEPDVAAERMSKVRNAGLEKITFAWAGELDTGKKHYYRVQGPTFLIEYDNSQNDGNHVHSVWRDFNGDFGRDLLREHIQTAHR